MCAYAKVLIGITERYRLVILVWGEVIDKTMSNLNLCDDIIYKLTEKVNKYLTMIRRK